MDHRPKEIGSDVVNPIVMNAVQPLPEDWIEWDMSTRRYPYMRKVITNEPGHLVFDGYFYIEDETVPVERILRTIRGDHHVEIYEKKTMEDTTVSSYDEEFGGYVSFFSTAIIDLHYRILGTLDTKEKYYAALDRIAELEKGVEERDQINQKNREERDYRDYLSTYNTESFPKSM